MSLELVRHIPLLKALVFKLWLWDARSKLRRIERYLRKNEKIIDIGSGSGSVTLLLRESGCDVTPVDVRNLTLTDEAGPRIYDGVRLPFDDGEFDVALMLTVLHHARDPERVLLEAKRVARRMVVIEDIYTTALQKHLTYFADSLVNLEFLEHPHNNKTDGVWRELFKRLGLELVDAQYQSFLGCFTQAGYFLKW
ncbi:MAG: methyltransferase domain-containing protein [Candidatus Dadabacteria bacterium]|nr:methyltransferase domain-containing protein [Candidatus Dadabacteria bacterium]